MNLTIRRVLARFLQAASKIRVPTTGWEPGKVTTYGMRHEVKVPSNEGEVHFIYEVDQRSRTFSFRGIQKLVSSGNVNEDIAPGWQKLGPQAVSSNVWKKIYMNDKARRSYYA